MLGHLGHHFPCKLPIQKVLSLSVSCTSFSLRYPPNMRPLRWWSCENIQALSSGSNFVLTSPKASTLLDQFKPLSGYYFFNPFPYIAQVRDIIGFHTLLPYPKLGPLGPMWSHSFEKTILQEPSGIPISIRILGIGKFLHKSYPINLT